ncbi:MAG TPA: Gfo/Idh/MocA family oxidoreductase, partial [Verrucomicrobiota bacterium]|nr:Gfo/Idh/MocA family oxidoreductase [Verrucomicrobiota bacterium]
MSKDTRTRYMSQLKKQSAADSSRRTFIKQAATAVTGVGAGNFIKTPVYGQSQAPSTGQVIGANDRINIGFVGVGNQGFNTHVRQIKNNDIKHNVAASAACDVFSGHRDRAQAFMGVKSDNVHNDYRKLLESKDIDAVVIATVDHWHAQVAIESMDAGKHVLIEKPMTRYLSEGFNVYDTCKRTKRVMQIGAVFCIEEKWHKAAQLVRDGMIGPLVLGQSSYCRNNPKGEWNYTLNPNLTERSIDWKRWLGKTGMRPFNADHFFRWRKYNHYCAGILGDLLAHKIHPLMIASGNPEFPRRVTCLGTRQISTDRDVPDNTQVLANFPSGYTLMVVGSTVNQQGLPEMLRGHHGTLCFGDDKVDLKPETAFGDETAPESFSDLKPSGADFVAEHADWFDVIRNGGETKGNIDLSMRAQVVISLAEMSERMSLT